ncbi:Rqc2 family fibronectin-binding protein [Dialister sp.]|jgi:predicted ribosome quality control (RQC) complex YloA/Tae2 family protein|uniref:Rqc2 family fibronectin-binding protein n=1 Tax=Dialister sp. TaxID=1955814 RepID=UPI003A5BA085
MQIDSAVLYVLVKELRKKIDSCQVRQIHQIDNRIMDLELYCTDGDVVSLIINTYNPPILYLTGKGKNKKQYSPSQTFCMTLRKYLEGSRLSKIEQVAMDRIVSLSFDRIERGSEIITRTLWLELLPAAPNMILTEGDTIIDACLRGKKLDRLLVPGETYHVPDNSNRMDFMKFTESELHEIFDFSKKDEIPMDSWLFKQFNGFSRFLADELASESGVPADKKLSDFTESEEKSLLSHMTGLARKIENSDHLYLYSRGKGKMNISPIPLSILGEPSGEVPVLSFMEKEAESGAGSISQAVQEYTKQLHTLIKREERKKRKIREEMEETSRMDQYKLWGTLLSIYAYEKINHQKEITVSNLFKDPPEEERIPVNPLLSTTDNSQAYFKKYNKMKTRSTIGQEKLKECEDRLAYLNETLYFAGQVTTKQDLEALKEELKSLGIDKRQKQHKKGNRKAQDPKIESRMIDGFRVYLGTSNTKNEYLTLRKAAKTDIWFHAKAIPGSHVVIETQGETVPPETLEKVASLAAWNSKGRESGKVDVDYTFIRYVKKIPNGPPGLVNYSHQKTIVAVPEDVKK